MIVGIMISIGLTAGGHLDFLGLPIILFVLIHVLLLTEMYVIIPVMNLTNKEQVRRETNSAEITFKYDRFKQLDEKIFRRKARLAILFMIIWFILFVAMIILASWGWMALCNVGMGYHGVILTLFGILSFIFPFIPGLFIIPRFVWFLKEM
jgi:hypothetical protein